MTLEKKIKTAIITGGSEGIGFAIAKKLLDKNYDVHLLARKIEKLENAKEKLSEYNDQSNVYIHKADIKDFELMKNIIDNIEMQYGIDVFVNNAGAYKKQDLDTNEDEIRFQMELNLIAPKLITHYLIRKFKNKDKNLIILTNISQGGISVFPDGIGYGSSKMGLIASQLHYEKQMKKEGIDNIRMIRIYPGVVNTPGVLEQINSGHFNAESIDTDDVALLCYDLICENILENDIYIGKKDGEILRKRYHFDLDNFSFLKLKEDN